MTKKTLNFDHKDLKKITFHLDLQIKEAKANHSSLTSAYRESFGDKLVPFQNGALGTFNQAEIASFMHIMSSSEDIVRNLEAARDRLNDLREEVSSYYGLNPEGKDLDFFGLLEQRSESGKRVRYCSTGCCVVEEGDESDPHKKD